jgi:hypothetical protein
MKCKIVLMKVRFLHCAIKLLSKLRIENQFSKTKIILGNKCIYIKISIFKY